MVFMRKSVLFIGLDGATWSLLKPWVDKEKLPTIEKLMASGYWGKLRSTIPALTAPAWTSIATGKNPGKTGIFDFVDKNGNLISSRDIKCKRIWNILSEKGRRCCIINYPYTYPPERINGVMISDFMTPPGRKNIVYPRKYRKLLEDLGYEPSLPWGKLDIAEENRLSLLRRRRKLLPEIYEITEKRFELAFKLAREKWDFFALVIKETDDILHFFWDDKDILLEYFRVIDEAIKKLITVFKEENKNFTTVIVSDHGFGESQKIGFNLYPILKEINSIEEAFYTSLVNLLISNPLGLFFARIVSRIWFLRKLINRWYVKSGSRLWGVHLKNEKIVRKLKKILENYRDPKTNEKIFNIVKLREEEYTGEYLEEAPNIVYVANPKYKPLFLPTTRLFLDSYSILPGDHFSYPEGIIIISPCSKRLKNLGKLEARTEDITPTILKILGISGEFEFDGKCLV